MNMVPPWTPSIATVKPGDVEQGVLTSGTEDVRTWGPAVMESDGPWHHTLSKPNPHWLQRKAGRARLVGMLLTFATDWRRCAVVVCKVKQDDQARIDAYVGSLKVDAPASPEEAA